MADSLAEEVERKAEKPIVGAERATAIAKDLFGLDVVAGSVKDLDSYDDRNFYLRATHGRGEALGGASDCNSVADDSSEQHFVLKVHNGVESLAPAFIECQNLAMEKVRATAGVWCPRALPSLRGETIARTRETLASGAEREHAVRLLPFRPGGLLASVPLTAALLHDLGAATARMSAALADFEHPAAHRENFVWDLAQAPAVRPLLEHSPTERHKLLGAVLDEFEAAVAPSAGQLRSAVIHGDVNDQNVLVDAAGTRVLGVIDFGDMAHSWLVNEIAIATAYVLIALHYGAAAGAASAAGAAGAEGAEGAEDAPAAPAAMGEMEAALAMTSSYAAQMHARGLEGLREAEWRALPTLIACRITVSLILGAYSSSRDPTNEYLKLTLLPGWRALQRLRAIPAAELSARMQQAAAAYAQSV